MSALFYRAPWNRSLKVSSTVALAVLIAANSLVWLIEASWILRGSTLILSLVVVSSALLGSVRSYSLSDTELEVRRIGSSFRLALADIESVEGKAEATLAAHRVVVGLFSYHGYYFSRELGILRSYATDPSRAVVLSSRTGKFVITPHDPQAFIMRARTFIRATRNSRS